MAESNTHQLRMAMASKEDVSRMYLMYNVIENIVKYGATTLEEFDHFENDEKKQIAGIFEDGEVNYEELATCLYNLIFGFHRVVMGFEVLRDNCADPDLDYLDFNTDIKEERRILNTLAEHLEKGLKEGHSLSIDPSSDLGKAIVDWAKEEEEVTNG